MALENDNNFLIFFYIFLVSSPQDYEINIMPSLEKIFSVKTGSNDPEDLYALQTAALSAWTLLYR